MTDQMQYDENGLIVPRKLQNPCLENRERKDLHRELMWNQRVGKNVLDTKTELEKAYEKRKEQQKRLETEREKIQRRSSFEMRLEKQAEKLKEYTIDGTNAKTPKNNQNQNQHHNHQNSDPSQPHFALHQSKNQNNNQDADQEQQSTTESVNSQPLSDEKHPQYSEFLAARAKFCGSPSLSPSLSRSSNPSSSSASTQKHSHPQ